MNATNDKIAIARSV